MQTIPRALTAHVDRQWAETDTRTRHRDRALALTGREYSRRLTCYVVRYNAKGDRISAYADEGPADVLASTIIADAERLIDTHVFRSQSDYTFHGPIVAYGRPSRVTWIGADASRAELADVLDRVL